MKAGGLQELAWRFLEKLYELSEGGLHPEVEYELIQSTLGFSREQTKSAAEYLESKGLVTTRCRVPCIKITPPGVDEVVRVMAEAYAEKMRRVLRKIYDMSGPPHTNEVPYDVLLRELGMSGKELDPILEHFDRRGLFGQSSDEGVCLSPEGVLEVQNPSTGRRGGDVYQTHIHGPNYGGIQQGTHGSTQNITLTNTNNPDFDRALASIVEIIRTSNLPSEQMEELEGDVVSVNKLALREPAPGLLDRAKSRLDLVKVGLQGADLLVKASPHLETVWEFLRQRFGG